MLDQHPSGARRDKGNHAQHDLGRGDKPPPGRQIGIQRPGGTGHQGEPHISGAQVLETLGHQALDQGADLTLRVDDERRAYPIGGCLNDRTDNGEHHRDRFARPRFAKGKEMTPEKLARDIALEGKQRMPLRNAQPGLRWVRNGIRFGEGTRPAGERIRERCRRAGSEIGDRGRCNHRIDQAQCAGKSARNRGLQGEELSIDGGERNTIAGTHRTVHLAREESQSTASRPRRASATRLDTGAEKLEDPAIALVRVGNERRISAERPIDKEIDMLSLEAAQIVMDLCRPRHGERF